MAYEAAQKRWGQGKAVADLRTHQFKGVKLTSAGLVALVAAATDSPVGVLQDDPRLGEPCCICYEGVTKVLAGGVLVPGNYIGFDSTARAIAVAVGVSVGQCIEGAGAAGSMATVMIACQTPRGST